LNCRDALRLLYDVVDREATEQDSTLVHEHLKTCRKCASRYELERKFKNCVEQKGKTSPECQELKFRIIQQLDAIDGAVGEVGPSYPPFRWAAVTLAAAATVILCLAAAFGLKGYYRQQTEFVPFVKAHLAHEADFKKVTFTYDPLDFLYQQTGIRLQPSPQLPLADIISITIDTVKGVRFGRIEMASPDGDMMSLFVTTRDVYRLPDGPCAMVNGSELLVNCCKKCTLVGFTRDNLVFVAVAARHHDPAEVADVARYF